MMEKNYSTAFNIWYRVQCLILEQNSPHKILKEPYYKVFTEDPEILKILKRLD